MQKNKVQNTEFQNIAKHLKVQSILFWIMGGLGIIFSLILVIAGVAFNFDLFEEPIRTLSSSERLTSMDDFEIMYFFFFLYVITSAVFQILNGAQLQKKKNRGISIFVAIYTIPAFPLGTALGIYSLIMMSLSQTKEFYYQEEEKRMSFLLQSEN